MSSFAATSDSLNIEGAMAFMRAYMDAPNDADIEIRLASSEQLPGQVFVVAVIGATRAVLTKAQTLALVKVCENTMHEFAGLPAVAGLPNLILALREGARHAR